MNFTAKPSFEPGHGYSPWKEILHKFSWETQTEGSRKTSKARMWRKNTLRKVLTSFHLYGDDEGVKCKRWEGDFRWNCRRGPTPLTVFGPVSLQVSQRLEANGPSTRCDSFILTLQHIWQVFKSKERLDNDGCNYGHRAHRRYVP